MQEKYNEWRQWLEKEGNEIEFNLYKPSTKEIQAFSEYAGFAQDQRPTESEMSVLESNYIDETLGKETAQEISNLHWYSACLVTGIVDQLEREIRYGTANRTKEFQFVIQRYFEEYRTSSDFLVERLEQYKQVVEEREEAFIERIEHKLDFSEPISEKDYATYKEYIKNRVSREAEQKKEENPLEEPKKEAERKPRRMGNAR